MLVMFNQIMRKLFKVLIFLVVLLFIFLIVFRLLAGFREVETSHSIAPDNGQFVAIEGEEMHIQTYGKASDKTILLIHGTAAWGGLWKETAVFLASKGYRVYALDLPPFGFSSRPLSENYSRIAQAKRMNALLKALKLKDTIIVGHSFGSGAAVEAVMQDNALFSGLVLIDAALNLAEKEKSVELPLLLKNKMIRELIVSATVTNPYLTEVLLKTLLYKKDVNLDKYVDILQKPMVIKGSTYAITQWLPFLLLDEVDALSSDENNYKKLNLPCELLWGNKDSVTPLSQGQLLKKLIKDSRLNILDEVGHIPQIENPEHFQKSLLKSLKRIESMSI
jgi:pimeloyl-ACP methyl ester carboxylesterase